MSRALADRIRDITGVAAVGSPGRRPRLDRTDLVSRTDARRRLGLPDDRVIVTCSSSISSRPRASASSRRCCGSRRPYLGVLVGDGPERWLRGDDARTPDVRRWSGHEDDPVHVGSRRVLLPSYGKPPDRPRRGGLGQPTDHRESGGRYPELLDGRGTVAAEISASAVASCSVVPLQPAGGGRRRPRLRDMSARGTTSTRTGAPRPVSACRRRTLTPVVRQGRRPLSEAARRIAMVVYGDVSYDSRVQRRRPAWSRPATRSRSSASTGPRHHADG